MDRTKLYTGRELVEHGVTKSENGFPVRGSKEVIPTGTWLEKKQIQKGLEDKKSMLCERIEKWGSLSHAEWVPEKRLVRYIERRGSYMQFFGFPENDSYFLYPEEALHLMEVNCLMLKYNGVTVSLQQAYGLLLDENITLEEYRVYSHLCRKGYKLLRFKSSEKQNLSNYEKSLNVQSLKKNKAFYKRVYSPDSNSKNSPSNSKIVDNSADVEMNDWRALPLAIVGEVIPKEKQESPIKKRRIENRTSESSDMELDNDGCISPIIIEGNNIVNNGDDCISVKSKDDDMDVDCVPVDSEPLVTMPNAYRREEILVITPNKKLLPPNVRLGKKSYKVLLNIVSKKSPIKRNSYSNHDRNFQNGSASFDRGPRRQFMNRSYSNFANHMFRHILQRQAYMANFWPPTFRHNCAPHQTFALNSQSLLGPFLNSPHVALYPQPMNTLNSFQNPLNNFINNLSVQYANNQSVISREVNLSVPNENVERLHDVESHCNKQLQQIKTLISKFDLLRTTPGVGESTLENVKNAIDNLLVTFNDSYRQNHTIDSLRNSISSTQLQVVNLSSDSEDDCTVSNGLNDNSKRKKKKTNNKEKNKDKCNNNNDSTIVSNLNVDKEELDRSVSGESNGTLSNNWLASCDTWAAGTSFIGKSRHSTFLYSEYLLGFMKKSKKSFSISSWKEAKAAFEESLQKDTVCVSDDDDDEQETRPKKVLLSLKVDKIQPILRPQDCSSVATILQRLSIIKKADFCKNLDDYKVESRKSNKICFDVYSSNAKNIKKEKLTKPLFRIVCRRVTDPIPSLTKMTELLQCCNDNVPLKWAIVAPSSITFLQFGNVDLPVLCRNSTTNE